MNQIDQIKEILFSNEKQALDALTRRIEGRESRVADIADVLPEAIGRSQASSEKIHRALQQPVESIFKDSVKRDPKGFADMLFPVMGPAIRRSITETLREFTESINKAVEQQVSVKSIKWRAEARRAGIPYAQYLLQRNLEYRVDHAYLIQPNSGLLIADAHRPEAIRRDDDAVSAMLTAIQDFVKDSFTTENQSGLETADIGEYTLWVMQGPQAMLACVIFGMPPRSLREEFIEILEDIHLQYTPHLDSFSGKQVEHIEPTLERCLSSQAKEEQETVKQSKLGFAGIVGFLLLGLMLWYLITSFLFQRDANAYLDNLKAEPGILLTKTDIQRGKVSIQGLRDPIAVIPEDLLTTSKLTTEQVDFDLRPFYSLEPAIIERRIRNSIEVPVGINIQIDQNSNVNFSGKVTAQFKELFNASLLNDSRMAGINNVTYSDLYFSDSALMAEVIEKLQPPETMNLSVTDQVASFAGSVDFAFYQKIQDEVKLIEGLNRVDLQNLEIDELRLIKTLGPELSGKTVFFEWRTQLTESSESELSTLAEQINSWGSSLEALGYQAELSLTGFTDPSGNMEQNIILQQERALYLKGRLVGLGVKPNWLVIGQASESSNSVEDSSGDIQSLRKVVISTKNQHEQITLNDIIR